MAEDIGIVVKIKGDDSEGVALKKTMDGIAQSGDKTTASMKKVTDAAGKSGSAFDAISNAAKKSGGAIRTFENELLSGGVTIEKFSQKMRNAGQSTETINNTIKRLGTTQKGLNAILAEATSPLERLSMKQAEYNKYLRAGILDQENYAIVTKKNQAAIAALNNEGNAANKIFGAAKGIIGAYLGAQAVLEIVKVADAFSQMRARVNSITQDTKETETVMRSLMATANSTGQSLEAGLAIFQRLSQVRKELGATNAQMLQFTDSVSKLGVISGASTAGMQSGLTQLGQMLSSNKARSQEWRSIMENIPEVGVQIAKQLGISTGEMQNLVAAGKVLTKDVFAAILNAQDEVNQKFANMPLTAARGFAELKNDLSQIVDQINSASGGTSVLGKMFQGVGEAVKMVYVGVTTMFDYILAAVAEFGNAINTLQNKGKSFANNFLPNSMQFQMEDTVDVGSVFAGTKADLNTRMSKLFVDQSATSSSKEALKLSKDYRAEADKLIKAGEKSAEQKKAERAALSAQKKQQQELTTAINQSRTAEEKLNDEIKKLEGLKSVAKTKDEVELLNRGIRNTQAELEKLRTQAELNSPLAKTFKAIADEVQDGFKDAFKGAFDGGGSMFKKFTDGIKATFKSMLLDLAYQAAVRPIVLSILTAGGSAAGLSASALGSILGTGTTGGAASAASGIGSLFSSGGSILSAGKALLSGGSITGGLGKIGGQISGFLGGNFSQNVAVQKFITQAGTFGNIAGGLVGSLGANLLGLGSKNALVNTATGTIGGLIGSAGGPLGSIAGSFIGTALGGLFGGGKPSDMAQGGFLNLATGKTSLDGQTGKKFSQANADFRDKIFAEVNNLVALLKDVGGTVKGTIGIVVGSRDGLRTKVGGTVTGNYGNNSAAFINAVMAQVVKSTTGLSDVFNQILKKIGVKDTKKLAEAFEFGKWYEALGKVDAQADTAADFVKILADSLAALEAQFKSARDMATTLGLPLSKINSEYEKQRLLVIESVKQQEALYNAQQAGFSSMEDMLATFNSFLNGQALGDNSSLNPLQKQALAQSNFDSLLGKAQGGDFTVTTQLLDAANVLIDIGRTVNASSVAFATLEEYVRNSVKDIAHQAGVPGYAVGTLGAQSGIALVGENGPELVRMRGGEQVYSAGQTANTMAMQNMSSNEVARTNSVIAGGMSDIVDGQKYVGNQIAQMRKALERLTAKMMVTE